MKSPEGGRLLDNVAYCMKMVQKAKNIVGDDIEVRDTFPYNPESKTSPETAKKWAEGYYNRNKTYVPEVIVRPNEPFSITITDLHVRSEGGRAYKVIDSENRRFDLREDQVLEVMKSVGIQPMGVVPGTFVWGILGSQIRLVLVGGRLYQSMVKGAQEKKESEAAHAAGKHPTESTLVPGHIYQKRDKSIHAFLGKVKSAGKVYYAFVNLPEMLSKIDDSPASIAQDAEDLKSDASWIRDRALRRINDREVDKKWVNMSWRERCDYAWNDAYNRYRFIHYYGIMLMSSPKFDADVGVLEADFFQELRSNSDRKHEYVDSKRNYIIQNEFLKAHPHVKGYLTEGDVWYCHQSWGEPNETERMTALWRTHKEAFYSGLEWL